MAIVKLQTARLSFPDLFEAKQFEGQGPFSYRAAFLLSENTPVMLQTADGWKKTTMQKVIEQVANEAWKAKGPAILKTLEGNPQKCCWYDGNIKEYDGYADNFVLSASRGQDKGRPLIVDTDKTPLTEKDGKPYAGCYVNGTVEIWAQDNKYGKGIRATLRGVQFVKDGDAFSAGTPVNDDEFDEIEAPETEDDIA
ncbi:ssDNA-binding protein [Paraburkholderia atlantica]|uniref:ssDNA-binding protein n=1 Tax=Paraburkholderia atlantica TaxID=2654982 RepID=UPI003D2539CB